MFFTEKNIINYINFITRLLIELTLIEKNLLNPFINIYELSIFNYSSFF